LISIDEYLEKLSSFVGDAYGKQFRSQFKDSRGSSELAMLAAPTREEYEQLKIAVGIMTLTEKEEAVKLSDQQVLKIADDAGIDAGIFAIFVNGYSLEVKKDNN
jgi:hypothetical protein